MKGKKRKDISIYAIFYLVLNVINIICFCLRIVNTIRKRSVCNGILQLKIRLDGDRVVHAFQYFGNLRCKHDYPIKIPNSKDSTF